MNRTRTITATAAATAAVSLALASSAIAAPVDVGEDSYEAAVANTVWESAAWDYYGFTIDEASVFADDVDPADPWAVPSINGDAFDGALGIWVEGAAYGLPTCVEDGEGDLCTYVVDVTTSAGDIVIQAPPQTMSGLQVAVQHRYYAGGDLARTLVSYTNPGTAAVSVGTGAFTDYGSDSWTVLEGDFTGDGAVTAADRWIITGDGNRGDPIVSTVWFGPQASLAPTTALIGDNTDYSYDESWAGFNLTVQPGQTVYLAFFIGIYGYEDLADAPIDGDLGVAAAVVATDYAGAVTAAAAATPEFAALSGRLTAGIPAGASVLNWGAAAADPATPVVARPAFTG